MAGSKFSWLYSAYAPLAAEALEQTPFRMPEIPSAAQARVEEAFRDFVKSSMHGFASAASLRPWVAYEALREAGLQAEAECVARALREATTPLPAMSLTLNKITQFMSLYPTSAGWRHRLLEALVALTWEWSTP